MSIITANDLRKTFQTKRKQPDLMGSLKAVVKGISFELEPNELLIEAFDSGDLIHTPSANWEFCSEWGCDTFRSMAAGRMTKEFRC